MKENRNDAWESCGIAPWSIKARMRRLRQDIGRVGCVGGEWDNLPEVVTSDIPSRGGKVIILAVKSKNAINII
jgi:hypothetical protein